MDDHKDVYREEAYELLAELESSLLELEQRPDDRELVSHVFRSMHTIKGSGAMFGFDDVAAFTHEIETVYDLVRDGVLKVDKHLIQKTLRSCDLIRLMIDGEQVDVTEERALVQAFQEMVPGKAPSSGADAPPGLEKSVPEGGETTYRIRFHPDPDIFRTGTNPVMLIDELREMGRCEAIAFLQDIPRLEEIDPEGCYLHWDLFLTTGSDLNAIRDVFIFVEDQCRLDIQAVTSDEMPDADHPERRIGEILVERGDISAAELDRFLSGKKRLGEMLVDAKAVGEEAVRSALMEQQQIREANRRKQEASAASSIRVSAEKLDALVDLVGELVTVQARLTRKAYIQADADLTAIAEEVERLSAELRDNTMNIRMLPVGNTFRKFKRLVRDLSDGLGKEVRVETEGEETDLDKTVLEQLTDPLMHLIRNTVDHGIEKPADREAAGKPRQGVVRLSAEHSGSEVLIRIADDGRGLDREAIRNKAIERGLISSDADLTEKEIYSLIFAPGFSTAKQVSDISGRGVGMDVVRSRIESLRGTVDIRSRKNRGTTVTLKLPLTLAITDGLLVRVGDGEFIIPLLTVEECLELHPEQARKARERNIIAFRDEIIPYIGLREQFKATNPPPEIEKVVVVESNKQRIGIGVDRVVGQHQTVIKSLGKCFRDVESVSGATILGDGTVALILDIHRLVSASDR